MANHQIQFCAGDAKMRSEAQRIGAAVDNANAAFAHVFFSGIGAIAFKAWVQFAGKQ